MSPPHRKLQVAPARLRQPMLSLPHLITGSSEEWRYCKLGRCTRYVQWHGHCMCSADRFLFTVPDMHTENIQFYVIPTRPFSRTSSYKYHSFTFVAVYHWTADGQMDLHTVYWGPVASRPLILADFPSLHLWFRLGSIAGQNVAVKRPFHKVY